MASASGPGDSLQTSEGKTRFVRLYAPYVLKGIIEKIQLWLPIRESSITFMKETADKLDEIEKEVDSSKLYGSSTGLAGVVLLGAGAVVSFVTMGTAAPYLIGAGLAATAGGGLVIGRADTKWMVNYKIRQDRVKDALTKDYAKEKEMLKEVQVLQYLVKQICEKSNHSEEKVLEDLLLTTFLKGQSGAECADPSPDQIKEIAQCLSSLAGVAVTFGAVLETSGAVAVGSALAAGAARLAISTAAPVVAAIDTCQLNTTSKSIAQGSRSEAAQKLRETADKLDEELHKHKDLLININI